MKPERDPQIRYNSPLYCYKICHNTDLLAYFSAVVMAVHRQGAQFTKRPHLSGSQRSTVEVQKYN